MSGSKRFSELQDEFFATSKRLRLAQKSEEKLALLKELQRIVQESKRALAETDSSTKKTRYSLLQQKLLQTAHRTNLLYLIPILTDSSAAHRTFAHDRQVTFSSVCAWTTTPAN